MGFTTNSPEDHGLVAVGGSLNPAPLLKAYRKGSFPWPEEGWPLMWWSPDPRAIFEFDHFHTSRRLNRTIRSGKFTVTVNGAFADVMCGCAERDEGTWITRDMYEAYCHLHTLGYAHSVEAWYQGQLAGGIYGVAIGGFFAGESMFYRVTDGSKVALAFLITYLQQRKFQLFDIQFLTDHTKRLGAVEIPRSQYLKRLNQALRVPTTFV